VHLPALPSRRGDIPVLVDHFVDKAAHQLGKAVQGSHLRQISAAMSPEEPDLGGSGLRPVPFPIAPFLLSAGEIAYTSRRVAPH
jgi:hypothetical protein